MELWGKEHPHALRIRELAFLEDRSYKTYRTYCDNADSSANVAICLIHQANYLLDRQLQALEKQFMTEGGFTERLYKMRKDNRGY